ncbi:MAG: hypothetical protein ACREUN_10180, partial [Burkholderiales bacterium]
MTRVGVAAALFISFSSPAQAGDGGVLWLDKEKLQPFRVQPAAYQPQPKAAVVAGPERWTRLALDMIVKYQQNPLRASRSLAILHAAMNDAALLAARQALPQPVALHRAAGITLAFLYPQEADGKYEG